MATVRSKDLYELLGVSETASDDEIRKAYRKLAHQHHPDKTGGDKTSEEKLKEINQAYDILKNKEKRAQYDQQRKYGAFEPGAAGFEGFSGFDAAGFGDFADFFGGSFGRNAQRAKRGGADLEASVRITLRDVALGTTKKLSIRRHDRCSVCAGSGGKPGTSAVTCPECRGSGTVSQGNGFFTINRACPVCKGKGQRYTEACLQCSGRGIETVTREINLRVPAGVAEGARLRVAGEGEPGDPGTPNGDLYVRVDIEPDPLFTRDGRDLICEVPVSFADAALGAKVRVPTLQGMADLTLKPGTQNGAQLRMAGMGLPAGTAGKNGDQIVKILVEVPRKLTSEQKKLLREFDQDYVPEAHPLKAAFERLLARIRG